MKMLRTDTNLHNELRDPQLTALLRETFANDPALEDAPGRAERIMRRLLASGVRPAPAPWRIWAWASGFAATAAVTALLVLVVLHAPPPQHSVTKPAPIAVLPVQPVPPAVIPEHNNGPRERLHTPRPPRSNPVMARNPQPPTHLAAPEPNNGTVTVASALYTAGATAHAAGDFATAYDAYSASYEASPNPETLLAASDALLHMDAEDNGSDG